MSELPSPVIERLETDLLMEALSRAYGLDVRRFGRATFETWALNTARAAGAGNVSALTERMLHDRDFGAQALGRLVYSDVQLFDDPAFWRSVRVQLIPWLRTTPYISIWLPQCAHGGGVYSMAILLAEAALYDRARIYATDADSARLSRAEQALISKAALQAAEASYLAAGGERALSEYFDDEGNNARLQARLSQNVVWSQFDPATGESFNEFHFIDGRLMSPGEARRSMKLLVRSLPVSGVLALDPEHGAELRQYSRAYKEWGNGLYQRVA